MNYPKHVNFEDPIPYEGYEIVVGPYESSPGVWSGAYKIFLNGESAWQSSVVNQFGDLGSAREALVRIAKTWIDTEID
jgi:hypothetical protein